MNSISIHLGQPELATANGRLKDELARAGLELVRYAPPYVLLSFVNMRDPQLGGNAREKIALRRAVHMAFDDGEWIRALDGGNTSARQQVVPPGLEGFVPGYRNPNVADASAANALLDRMGYARGESGIRRNPDGSALTIRMLVDTTSQSRKRAEFVKRMLDRIGVRATFDTVGKGESIRRMVNCRYGMAIMDWGFDIPDGIDAMIMFHSGSGQRDQPRLPGRRRVRRRLREGADDAAGRCAHCVVSHHAVADRRPRCRTAAAGRRPVRIADRRWRRRIDRRAGCRCKARAGFNLAASGPGGVAPV